MNRLSIHSDGHVHSKYCHHASGEMEEYVLHGITVGLKEITFLEHMEAGVHYFESTWLTEDDFDRYFREGRRLQDKYRDVIRVSLGVEVGYSPDHREELLDRLAKRKWDRIGISYHFMAHPDGDYHLNLLSRQKRNISAITEVGCERVVDTYFATLIEALEILPGTVLCHLDAPLRFHPRVNINEGYLGPIREILTTVKKKGMELEINTSGFTIREAPFPAPFIIQEAMALDIPLSAGSDAHRPEDVGRHFDRLPEMISSLPAG